MHHRTLYKPFILSCYLAILSSQGLAYQDHPKERSADIVIGKLYHSLDHKPISDISARITTISAQFLGQPYLLGALGEGMQGEYDQSPLYRTDAFDCETYVDLVIALALSKDPNQFKHYINLVRYHNGEISFTKRNHFTCLDWNKNNQQQGFLKDITTTFRDIHHRPIVKYARAMIDKPAWYANFSLNKIKLNNTSQAEQKKRLQHLQSEGHRLSRTLSIMPYIPLSALFNDSGQPNYYLFKQIPNASIIEIVRPDWDLSKTIGTHLNVSHLGFAIWQNKTLLFRQASSDYQHVVDVPLIGYLLRARKSPTIKGINIQIVVPDG